MHLITTIGEYSIAQPFDDSEAPLMVRAASREDLEMLRSYVSELTEVEDDPFVDNTYIAHCPLEALKSGLEQMILHMETEPEDEQIEMLF